MSRHKHVCPACRYPDHCYFTRCPVADGFGAPLLCETCAKKLMCAQEHVRVYK